MTTVTITLTVAEAKALSVGLGSTFGDEQDEHAVFGNKHAVAAAYRADAKLDRAIYEAENGKK